MVGRPYICPHCSSTNTVWKGYRKREKDRVRLRRCRSCMRRFTTRVVEPNEESPTPITDLIVVGAPEEPKQEVEEQ